MCWPHTHLRDSGRGAVSAALHLDDGVAHLQRPRVHDGLDGEVGGQRAGLVRRLRQVSPQVVLLGVVVFAESEQRLLYKNVEDSESVMLSSDNEATRHLQGVQVGAEAVPKGRFRQEMVHHSDD